MKVEVNGKAKKLSAKQYKIINKDPENNRITIQGKGKNFTGTVEIDL